MLVKPAGVVVLGCLVCGFAHAGSGAASPSAEMLEFLGTYETSSGKEVDPLALSDVVGRKKDPAKKTAGKTTAVQRKNKKKDGVHE